MAPPERIDAYSRSFDRALVLAALVHRRQVRKGTVVPYIIHPVHVAALLLRHGYGEPLVTAAILHDVVEDVEHGDAELQVALGAAFPHAGLPARIEGPRRFRTALDAFLATEFAPDVMGLVRLMTEPKNADAPDRPWRERKLRTLEHLEAGPEALAALKAADALHNVRSILEDVEHHGAAVMDRFGAPPADVLWYYAAVARQAEARLQAAPLARELSRAVEDLARFVATLPTQLE